MVVFAVPWDGWDDAVSAAGSLDGKIVIDTTNQYGSTEMPVDGETGASFHAARADGARYTKSFNTLTSTFQAEAAFRPEAKRVVQWVCGDDDEAKQVVMGLIADAGYVPVDIGGNADAAVMEAPRRPGAVYGDEYRLPEAEKVVEAVRAGQRDPTDAELRMSATATTTTADQCLAPGRVEDSAPGARYRRLFDGLPPLEVDDGALHALGRAEGPCDDSAVGGSADANVAAGWPFFGQFVAHDITADRSPIGHRTDPGQIRNFRTPRANLEGVYGSGPVGSPYLYDKDDPVKLLLGEGGHDVPRNHQGIALLGDQRNDVHLFVSQMQVAFIRTHNRIVDRLRADGVDEGDVFEEARRTATWHYQWVILTEFLPLLVGHELVG